MGTPLSDEALDTIFRTARTYNGYTDTPVTEAQIHEIYALLKMGPTSANQQPGRFAWCLSQEAKDKLADCAAEGNVGRLGHGLGMQLTEWPSHIPDDHTVLEEGMVLTLEPGIETRDGRMMVHEEDIVVRSNGAEFLSPLAANKLVEV